jgi:hypothetical protein
MNVPPNHELAASVNRVARVLVCVLLVVGSLLTFPAGVPWMMALWLALHTAIAVRGGSGWTSYPLFRPFAILCYSWNR